VAGAAAAREFRVVVRLERSDAALRPGLTCDVRIQADEARDTLTLPLQAVVLRPDGSGPQEGRERSGVFVVEGGVARFTPVETGIIGGLDIQIKEGLKEGATVVVGPFQALRDLKDGARVEGREAE
ncbi:MAG TPA: hypothetical protein VJ885_19265, partial [Thermoanaerobaculia bacterium]|nr:hypothetical protein [Thermoanaerobaculia bacterium]